MAQDWCQNGGPRAETVFWGRRWDVAQGEKLDESNGLDYLVQES